MTVTPRRSSLAGLMGWFVAIGGALLSTSMSAIAQHTFLAFNSTPGSWVGQGFTNYFVSPETNWRFTANVGPPYANMALHTNSLDPDPPSNDYYWDLSLGAPEGQTLQVGFYANAVRSRTNPTQPLMDFTGNHRGNNVISGWFHILEAEYEGSTLLRFAVDFRQHDEGDPNQWVDGQWRFNSTIPEPTVTAIAAIIVPLLLRRKPRCEGRHRGGD